MKKAWILLGVIALGAVAGGVAAWGVLKYADRPDATVVVSQSRTPQAGSQFTAYQADQYPDLTYAAENAVKAVVNIEVIQKVEMSRREYDPFFEFFGIPRQQNRGPVVQERRAGGSGVIISEDGR